MTPFKVKKTKKGMIAFGEPPNGRAWRYMKTNHQIKSDNHFLELAENNYNKCGGGVKHDRH